MNKICAYTCITGEYDILEDISFIDDNIDYFCFTNNKNIKSDFWKVIYIDNDGLNNVTLARKIKILGHKKLEKYDITIWLDGAINVLKPLSQFLNEQCDFDKYDMIGFKHQFRDCIYDEMNECIRLFKETTPKIDILKKYLSSEKYPAHNGLIESTVLVRKNNDKVKKLMDLWFKMIVEFSHRDQLSFNYCLWKQPISINFLDMYVYDNPYFKHRGHVSNHELNVRLYIGDSNSFDYKNVLDTNGEYNNDYYSISFIMPFDSKRLELSLIDEQGSVIEYAKLKTGKYASKIFNVYHVYNEMYAHDTPIIVFDGDFKKNKRIEIMIKLNPLSKVDLVERLNSLAFEKQKLIDEVSELKASYNVLMEDYNSILNSKGWKFLEKLRKIKNIGKNDGGTK